jgi:hypothetical protein
VSDGRHCCADLAIIDGHLNSLGASLHLHPDAPVKDSIAEVAYRLEDIRATCKAAGIPPDLYRQALRNLERYARRFGVHINTAVLAEPKAVVDNRITVGDNATGIAITTGCNSSATVFAAPRPEATPEQITVVLLRQFITELARTEHPDRTGLAEAANEACQVLAEPTPRLGRLAGPARPPADEQHRPGKDPQSPRSRTASRRAHRPGPFLCYLTIDGLDRESDPQKATRLRGRINATAAEQSQTSYHATDSTISIGIRGPDAAERIYQLRRALAKLAAKHGWTFRDDPR